MGLFRNKEIKILITIIMLVSTAVVIATYLISPACGIITACFSLIAVLSVLSYIHWHYRQLNKLIDVLRRVNSGDYSLDLNDNEEGEISILKSEIYKVTLMLREQNESLKNEKTILANSLADISHQLKTPLTSLFVMADLLSKDNFTKEERTGFIKRIHSQLERLQWLVESLLKLSKLDAKTVTFKTQSVLPSDLINKALSPLLIPIDIKNQTLNIKADDKPVNCDLNWTAEALLNILKNCVEHTSEGGKIDITVSSNALYTSIIIQDNGKGIDKSDLPYIFNRFYKGKNASEDSVGIGLAMAKSIIEAHGGSIQAKSEPGSGTIFNIQFPRS